MSMRTNVRRSGVTSSGVGDCCRKDEWDDDGELGASKIEGFSLDSEVNEAADDRGLPPRL